MDDYKQGIIEILNDLRPDVSDWDALTELVHGGVLDSLCIVTLIAEMSDRFDIEIPPQEITYENFDTLEGLVAMARRLAEE